MSTNDFRLVTLGRLALLHPDGTEDPALGKRRRKLALLAVLARAEHPLERDFLIEMFWGDQDESRARHSLSDALSHLRRVLGPDSITARRNDVALGDAARLAVDSHELVRAAAAKDARRVVELYRGPFLAFVHVPGSASFDQWLSRERDFFRSSFARAAASHCAALAGAGEWDECARVAVRWLDEVPLSADAALQLIRALSSDATHEADARALEAYDQLAARLHREYETDPDPCVAEEAAAIAARLASRSTSHEAVDSMASAAAGSSATSARRHTRSYAIGAGLAAMAAAVLAAFGILALRARTDPPRSKPAIAIVAIRNHTGDSTDAWLSTGLPQMMAADLSRSTAVDVVDPSRVHQVLARAGVAGRDSIPLSAALDLGRSTGATWVVDGTLSRANDAFILDFDVRDVATRALVRPYTVSDSSVISLADHAAARLLIAANASAPGPHLAEVETSSLEAYQHYVRAVQAGDEGRDLDQRREVDAAIALDSGFVAALRMRLDLPGSADDDPDAIARLYAAFERAAPHASERERLEQNAMVALRTGERFRSEALARLLVERFPRDPHSYAVLANVYNVHGSWAAADTVFMRELSLDSLATEAGNGPCAPCVAYAGLIEDRASAGDLRGAEQAANRWIRLQPDLPRAWAALSTVLSYEQRFDEALTVQRRAAALAGNDAESRARVARILIMARRWHQADSLIALWSRSTSRDMRLDAADLRMLLQRERGRFQASIATAESVAVVSVDVEVLRLTEGNSLGVLGEDEAARRLYEKLAHAASPAPTIHSSVASLDGDRARSFCWEHALEADAIAASGDTVLLRVLADSIELVSEKSYYGRDWRLAHHVRGLIAMRQHRYADAVREFRSARWGVAGWTRTLAELARAQLALGRPHDAIATLRDAYKGPVDAMGRYETRSQLDFLMARSYAAAGMSDSAAVYSGYVRTAWRDADPAIRARLASLP